jgi:hypothetical protein
MRCAEGRARIKQPSLPKHGIVGAGKQDSIGR